MALVKRFHCPRCRKHLQASVARIVTACPACGLRFKPTRYRIAVKQSGAVERISQVMHRSGN